MSDLASFDRRVVELRQFARITSGSQKFGDKDVDAILKELPKDHSSAPPDSYSRIALFRSYVRRVSGKDDYQLLAEALSGDGQSPLGVPSASLPHSENIAFMLAHFIGMRHWEILQIMEIDALELDALLDRAQEQIAAQTSTGVLLIEDELFIASQIEDTVVDLGHWICGTARTRTEATRALGQLQSYCLMPGLVLSDIQLADGSSGIDAVNDIATGCAVPTVFITAYPERLLTGRCEEPTFLLRKPFTQKELKSLISQALYIGARRSPVGIMPIGSASISVAA